MAGFGFSNGLQFSHASSLPLSARLFNGIRCILYKFLRPQVPCAYVRGSTTHDLGLPYILLDFIDDSRGKMLSVTWSQHLHDQRRRSNLLRGLSHLKLSMGKFPQPSIGCLRFNENATVALNSPPQFCVNRIMEENGSPGAPQSLYSTTGQFLDSLLAFRCNTFRVQPNAVHNAQDGHFQMGQMVLLRSLMPSFIDMHYSGPFVLQHSDLHASNIFVDDDWNITGIIDLEFMCSRPPSMLNIPYWLTVDAIDLLVEHPKEHQACLDEYLDILRNEEQRTKLPYHPFLSDTIEQAWNSGAFWVYKCLTSINALTQLMEDAIWPRYGFKPSRSEEKQFFECLSRFWSKDSAALVDQKVLDKALYDDRIRAHFEATAEATSNIEASIVERSSGHDQT